jgi:hypothetical protein
MNPLRVWKFELRPYHTFLSMPVGATVLSAGVQGDGIFVWALCDPLVAKQTRGFVVAGTGEPIPPEYELGRFVGTVAVGELIFHVWETA